MFGTRTFPRWLTGVLRVLVVVGLVAFGLRAWYRSSATEYRSFVSPDGRFKMVVYRLPMLMVMPGQSSDAPGFIRLYDQRSGRLLQQANVEMVQLVDRIEWSSTNVHVRLLADWRLPQ